MKTRNSQPDHGPGNGHSPRKTTEPTARHTDGGSDNVRGQRHGLPTLKKIALPNFRPTW